MGLFKTDFVLGGMDAHWLHNYGVDKDQNPAEELAPDNWPMPPKHLLGPNPPDRVREAFEALAIRDTPLLRVCAMAEICEAIPGTYLSDYLDKRFESKTRYFVNLIMGMIISASQPQGERHKDYLLEWAIDRAALQRVLEALGGDEMAGALKILDVSVEGRLKKHMRKVEKPAFVTRHEGWWAEQN
jgi:hypothetical protein